MVTLERLPGGLGEAGVDVDLHLIGGRRGVHLDLDQGVGAPLGTAVEHDPNRVVSERGDRCTGLVAGGALGSFRPAPAEGSGDDDDRGNCTGGGEDPDRYGRAHRFSMAHRRRPARRSLKNRSRRPPAPVVSG
ncbi:MAG: hypothetical protein FD127_2548 [Acidimicrobiaceae bacterium]|nr:MAG: hypothetical protein FD127_2548 [Acidimicrobiaceae bacterium]